MPPHPPARRAQPGTSCHHLPPLILARLTDMMAQAQSVMTSDQAPGHAGKRRLDRGGERTGRTGRQLHRDPRGGPLARVEEVDVERVLGPRVLWMVEVDGRLGEAEPAG